MARLQTIGGLLLLALLALAVPAATPPPKPVVKLVPIAPVGPSPITPDCRYLFVVDTSSVMQRYADGLYRTTHRLLANGLGGRMQEGDVFTIWTYADTVLTREFPLNAWTPELNIALANRAYEFLALQKFRGKSNLRPVFAEMGQALAIATNLTVIFISDGTDVVVGTPFDRAINVTYGKRASEMRSTKMPFITSFVTERGEFTHWTVRGGLEDIGLPFPAKPALPVVLTPPFTVATAPAPAPIPIPVVTNTPPAPVVVTTPKLVAPTNPPPPVVTFTPVPKPPEPAPKPTPIVVTPPPVATLPLPSAVPTNAVVSKPPEPVVTKPVPPPPVPTPAPKVTNTVAVTLPPVATKPPEPVPAVATAKPPAPESKKPDLTVPLPPPTPKQEAKAPPPKPVVETTKPPAPPPKPTVAVIPPSPPPTAPPAVVVTKPKEELVLPAIPPVIQPIIPPALRQPKSVTEASNALAKVELLRPPAGTSAPPAKPLEARVIEPKPAPPVLPKPTNTAVVAATNPPVVKPPTNPAPVVATAPKPVPTVLTNPQPPPKAPEPKVIPAVTNNPTRASNSTASAASPAPKGIVAITTTATTIPKPNPVEAKRPAATNEAKSVAATQPAPKSNAQLAVTSPATRTGGWAYLAAAVVLLLVAGAIIANLLRPRASPSAISQSLDNNRV